MEQITIPSKDTVVCHLGFGNDQKYPCDVLIIDGNYNINSQSSNYWKWRRILKDGSLGKETSGYGNFVRSKNNYKVETIVTKI